MIKKEQRICNLCERPQVVLPGKACRYCGHPNVYRTLAHAKTKTVAETPFDWMRTKRDWDALPESGRKFLEYLIARQLTMGQFIRRYNNGRRATGAAPAPSISHRKLKFWIRGQFPVPRDAAIRIARMLKFDGIELEDCPVFHPHAAMRAYKKRYYEFWRAHRPWFASNPGVHPGRWWEKSWTPPTIP